MHPNMPSKAWAKDMWKQILYTIYSPAEHKPTTVHHTKEEGDKEEDDGIDVAPEWSQKSKKENEDAGLVKESGKY